MSAHYKPHKDEPDSVDQLHWGDQPIDNLQIYGPQETKLVTKRSLAVTALFAVFFGIVFGVVIGYFAHSVHNNCGSELTMKSLQSIMNEDPRIRKKLLNEIQPDTIKEFLRKFSIRPHLAGTSADLQQAEEIKRIWLDQGLDEVKLFSYDVLLSYSDKDKLSKVMIVNESGKINFTSQTSEKVLSQEQNQGSIVPPFVAYSAEGTIEGDLLYVNYGRLEDFQWLEEKKSINISDKIVLLRYGKINPAEKVANAVRFESKGVIFYADPIDFTQDIRAPPYPKSWWLPGTGIQRSSAAMGFDGDPQTPGYPSLDYAYRLLEDKTALPKVPIVSIGFDDAKILLGYLAGDEVPSSWKGRLLSNYRLGPGFGNPNSTWCVRLEVSVKKKIEKTYNVIGYIHGNVEPDRYIILGNHRDAWVYGGVDPVSGTAALLEVTRALGKLIKEGWRPRRSLIFCSWGASEFNLIGSTEWVEQFLKPLQERTVAYLNVDLAVQGNYSFTASSSPLLYHTIYNATRWAPNPNQQELAQGKLSVFDTWLNRSPKNKRRKPRINFPSSESDLAAFIFKAGIPSMDIYFTHNYNNVSFNTYWYPLRHTGYETFHLVDKLLDPDYRYHLTIARIWAEIARELSDSLILPYDCSEYGFLLEQLGENLRRNYEKLLKDHNIKLDYLDAAINKFTLAAEAFNVWLNKLDITDPMAIRKANDQMMQVERAFLDPIGIPSKSYYKHLILAPNYQNSYHNLETFPGLADSLTDIEKAENQEERWRQVHQQYTALIYVIQSATLVLL